jgi:DNA polymerase-3 subunit delta'
VSDAPQLLQRGHPLPWHEAAWQQLGSALANDNLPHAILVCGSAGIGKDHFVKAFAARLMCQQPDAGFACGSCRSCALVMAGTHGDLRVVSPVEDSRAIKIEQVRALIEFSGRTASLGARKVVVITPAEAMNNNAANALLKSLEEPARDTYLLLVSHSPSALAATVRSRCQRLALATPGRRASLDWLTSACENEAEAADLLDLADGAPLAAWRLKTSGEADTQRALARQLEALCEGKLSAVEVSTALQELPLEAGLAALARYLEADIRKNLTLGQRGGLLTRFALLDELRSLQRLVANGGNPNPQLALEDAAARLAGVMGSVAR